MEMRKCRKCGKALVGREKRLCKSCHDKITDAIAKFGKAALGVLAILGSMILSSDWLEGRIKD